MLGPGLSQDSLPLLTGHHHPDMGLDPKFLEQNPWGVGSNFPLSILNVCSPICQHWYLWLRGEQCWSKRVSGTFQWDAMDRWPSCIWLAACVTTSSGVPHPPQTEFQVCSFGPSQDTLPRVDLLLCVFFFPLSPHIPGEIGPDPIASFSFLPNFMWIFLTTCLPVSNSF